MKNSGNITDIEKTDIEVLTGLRFQPEQFLQKIEKSKRLRKQGITCQFITVIYGLCWILQFRIRIQATKKTSRYIGYYAGFDETVMSPGKLALLPGSERKSVDRRLILADKLTEKEAVKRAWEYNKQGIIRTYRILQNPPELVDYVADRCYKPLYLMEFHNSQLDEKKYRLLDSLTGDLQEFRIE